MQDGQQGKRPALQPAAICHCRLHRRLAPRQARCCGVISASEWPHLPQSVRSAKLSDSRQSQRHGASQCLTACNGCTHVQANSSHQRHSLMRLGCQTTSLAAVVPAAAASRASGQTLDTPRKLLRACRQCTGDGIHSWQSHIASMQLRIALLKIAESGVAAGIGGTDGALHPQNWVTTTDSTRPTGATSVQGNSHSVRAVHVTVELCNLAALVKGERRPKASIVLQDETRWEP